MSLLRRKIGTVVFSSISLLAAFVGCEQGAKFAPPPPPEVTVSLPTKQLVTNYVEYTGTTKAVETVDLRARVKGFLKERHFEEGNIVKAGQLLLVIDEEPFQVALELAKARHSEAEAAVSKAEQSKSREVGEAQLTLDQAVYVLATLEEARTRALLLRNAGTREALDQAEATSRKGKAQVVADQANLEQIKADYLTNISSAKANADAAKSDVRNAEINLGYCRISAPFEGRISRRAFDVGNLVGDGQATVLATIYKDNPIYSYVNISENDLLKFRQMAREGLHGNFEKGDPIDLDLGLANELGFPHHGRLNYADPVVDSSTGTVVARGLFDNPDRVILPGLFVRVRVAIDKQPDALLVPESAIGMDQAGRYLLIVDDKNVVQRRSIKVGSQVGNLQVVIGDLKEQDRVIVKGLQRARPDVKVQSKTITPREEAVKTASEKTSQP